MDYQLLLLTYRFLIVRERSNDREWVQDSYQLESITRMYLENNIQRDLIVKVLSDIHKSLHVPAFPPQESFKNDEERMNAYQDYVSSSVNRQQDMVGNILDWLHGWAGNALPLKDIDFGEKSF